MTLNAKVLWKVHEKCGHQETKYLNSHWGFPGTALAEGLNQDLELGTELQYSDADIPLSVLTAGVNIHRFSAKYRLGAGGGGLALWHSMLSLCLVLLTQFSVNILGKVAEKESNT